MPKNPNSNSRSSRRTIIQSVERALNILEIIGNARTPISNREIAEKLGISSTTANNLIRTLYILGYLTQHRGGRYTLGMQAFILGSNTDVWSELRIASLEPMRKLSQVTQVTCLLGVLYQHQFIAINVIYGRNPTRFAIRQNWLDQYHSTAAGKVLLSALPEAELDALLEHNTLRKLTDRTVYTPDELKKSINKIRQQGYAVVRDESVSGISSLGVPIHGSDGRVIAALSTSFSSCIMTDDFTANQLEMLQKTRQKIEKNLGINL